MLMKKSCFAIMALAICVSAFAQVKTTNPPPKTTTSHEIKPATKANTVNSAIDPMRAQVLKQIEIKMIKVEGGKFTMGCAASADTAESYYWEKPAHEVRVNTFYISKFSVTQKEWEAVVGTRPWFSKDCPECPVENVSWFDAQVFINTLNQLTGRYYRLPTEAEWEYAAKGGVKSKGYKYAGGNDPKLVAWYDENSNKVSHPIGQKQPNELGLYDMSGNVWQWCQDWFDDKYYNKKPNNCDKDSPGIVDNPSGPGNQDEHDFY